jgi:hypothetical protein
LDWDEPAGLVARLDEAGDQLKVAKAGSAFFGDLVLNKANAN